MEILRTLVLAVVCLLALKTVIGFHFPWERCDCCGRRYRYHVKRG